MFLNTQNIHNPVISAQHINKLPIPIPQINCADTSEINIVQHHKSVKELVKSYSILAAQARVIGPSEKANPIMWQNIPATSKLYICAESLTKAAKRLKQTTVEPISIIFLSPNRSTISPLINVAATCVAPKVRDNLPDTIQSPLATLSKICLVQQKMVFIPQNWLATIITKTSFILLFRFDKDAYPESISQYSLLTFESRDLRYYSSLQALNYEREGFQQKSQRYFITYEVCLSFKRVQMLSNGNWQRRVKVRQQQANIGTMKKISLSKLVAYQAYLKVNATMQQTKTPRVVTICSRKFKNPDIYWGAIDTMQLGITPKLLPITMPITNLAINNGQMFKENICMKYASMPIISRAIMSFLSPKRSINF